MLCVVVFSGILIAVAMFQQYLPLSCRVATLQWRFLTDAGRVEYEALTGSAVLYLACATSLCTGERMCLLHATKLNQNRLFLHRSDISARVFCAHRSESARRARVPVVVAVGFVFLGLELLAVQTSTGTHACNLMLSTTHDLLQFT